MVKQGQSAARLFRLIYRKGELIFQKNFRLGYVDICDYKWAEVDGVDDLIKAKNIYEADLRDRK